MQTVHETITTVQFDTALRVMADRARTRYAGEAARIDRALVIALNGGVTLHQDGTARVQSSSDAEVVYHVGHGTCDCPDFERAPAGRCKHVWARCFLRKALKHIAEQAAAQTYYASYVTPDGLLLQGTATWIPAEAGWLFIEAETNHAYLTQRAHALVLGGNVALVEAQRVADGNLVARVCGYAN
jgi:hypothetical protein